MLFVGRMQNFLIQAGDKESNLVLKGLTWQVTIHVVIVNMYIVVLLTGVVDFSRVFSGRTCVVLKRLLCSSKHIIAVFRINISKWARKELT